MNDVTPRYEFRAFAQSFGIVADNIRRVSACEGIQENTEIYFVSPNVSDFNVKIRGESLDVKSLVGRNNGLEQWKPLHKQSLPLAAEFIRETFLPMMEIADSQVERGEYTVSELIDAFIRLRTDIGIARVFKRRFRFKVDGCTTELDDLLINGAAIRSVAIESEDSMAVAGTMERVGLREYENVNYVLAVKRMLGLGTLPDNAWYARLS